jgi:hypothetical protein
MSTKTPGVYRRLIAFFEANPDEELTRADIIVKFDASTKNVDAALSRARLERRIESVHAYRVPVMKRGAK